MSSSWIRGNVREPSHLKNCVPPRLLRLQYNRLTRLFAVITSSSVSSSGAVRIRCENYWSSPWTQYHHDLSLRFYASGWQWLIKMTGNWEWWRLYYTNFKIPNRAVAVPWINLYMIWPISCAGSRCPSWLKTARKWYNFAWKIDIYDRATCKHMIWRRA